MTSTQCANSSHPLHVWRDCEARTLRAYNNATLLRDHDSIDALETAINAEHAAGLAFVALLRTRLETA
jgi:hypothetical protein